MSEKKKIKIDFVDMWPGFKKTDNYFYNRLIQYYDVEITSEPDYLFASCFGDSHLKYTNCIKIQYLGENIIPDFNLFDYSFGFHLIDFEDRYLRLPHYVLYVEEIDKALKKHTYSDEYYLSKKGFCSSVISNPFAAGQRDEMYFLLNGYKEVASGGRYRNNVGGPVADKTEFLKNYRFNMAFENSGMRGYTTEKIFDAFAGEAIPIYWGDPSIAEEFNPEAFINCHDFTSFEEALQKVIEVYEDDEKYLAMVKAPIITESSRAKEYLKEDYIDSFLRNIFDQEKEAAYRRNMIYIGRDYQKRMKDASKMLKILNIVRKPYHQIKKWKAQLTTKELRIKQRK